MNEGQSVKNRFYERKTVLVDITRAVFLFSYPYFEYDIYKVGIELGPTSKETILSTELLIEQQNLLMVGL